MCINRKVIKGRWEIVESHCRARELSEINYIWLLGLTDLGILRIWFNYCELKLESMLEIVRVDYRNLVNAFLIEMKKIGQRNAKREWRKLLDGLTEPGIFQDWCTAWRVASYRQATARNQTQLWGSWVRWVGFGAVVIFRSEMVLINERKKDPFGLSRESERKLI